MCHNGNESKIIFLIKIIIETMSSKEKALPDESQKMNRSKNIKGNDRIELNNVSNFT